MCFSAPSITASIQEGGDLYQGQFEYVKGGEWIGHLIRSHVSPDGIVNMQHPDNWNAAEVVREQAEKNARRIWTVLPGADLDNKTNYNNFIADNSADINPYLEF